MREATGRICLIRQQNQIKANQITALYKHDKQKSISNMVNLVLN